MKKLIVAVAALALMAGSAYAAEWNFYGNARVQTTWYNCDVIDGASGDTLYSEGLLSTARIGAKVKVSDELSGRFEYGASGGKANVRHLYGTWDFGGGSLTIGQTDTALNITYSNQIALSNFSTENGLGGFGDCDTGRAPQLMLTFGGFKISVLATSTDNNYSVDTEAVIPKIVLSYTFGFDMGEVTLGGGYNTFDAADEDITSYVVGAGTNLNFGPAGLFATAVYGQNTGNIVGPTYTGIGAIAGTTVTGEINDVETMGFTFGLLFTVNDMFALEAGYGYVVDEYDEGGAKDKAESYYIQAPITLAPGVVVVPEVGIVDMKETTQNEWTYFGAKWQINF